MKVNANELAEIRNYLIKQRWGGMEFVAFPVNRLTRQQDLFTFPDQEDAHDFCQEMQKYNEAFNFLSTRSAYRAIDATTENEFLSEDRHVIINIKTIVEEYHKRLKEQDLETIKEKEEKMNQENFEYLGKQMLYAGLGEVPLTDLQEKLKEGNEEFQLHLTKKVGTDNVMAKLNFKRSKENTDMYFFNSYDVLLKKDGEEKTMQQNFRISYGNDFRFDEAHKLMSGRAVHKVFVMQDRMDKEIRQEYPSWNYLDFKDVNEYGNFKIVKDSNYDIEKKLAEYPIKELDNESTKAKMITDLKRGDVVAVTIATHNGELKAKITANAQFDSLNLFNENMVPLNLSNSSKSEKLENGIDQKQDQKEEQKQDIKQGKTIGKKIEKPAPAENNSKGKRLG